MAWLNEPSVHPALAPPASASRNRGIRVAPAVQRQNAVRGFGIGGHPALFRSLRTYLFASLSCQSHMTGEI